jgi:hypothetical protein
MKTHGVVGAGLHLIFSEQRLVFLCLTVVVFDHEHQYFQHELLALLAVDDPVLGESTFNILLCVELLLGFEFSQDLFACASHGLWPS